VQIIASPPADVGSSPGWAGYIYSEGTGRRWLSEDRQQHEAFQNGQWNQFRVRVNGPRIQSWVNGQQIADITDEEGPEEGFIGLQIHRVPEGVGPYQARWRNIRLRPIE